MSQNRRLGVWGQEIDLLSLNKRHGGKACDGAEAGRFHHSEGSFVSLSSQSPPRATPRLISITVEELG